MMPAHTLYGYELSYFTRKVEAALQLKGITYRRASKTLWRKWAIERRVGTHQVPVLRTPDGRLLFDSTPIVSYLDGLNIGPRLHDDGPRGVLIRVVEEWLDEWLPRAVIHFRWNLPECAEAASLAIAKETLPRAPSVIQRHIAAKIATWGKRACRALGVDNPHQQAAAEGEVVRLFDALERQLHITPYAMGDCPTAVDATLIGGLRAHFLNDPVPRRLLSAYPKVLTWAERATAETTRGALPSFPDTTDFGRFILAELTGPYRTMLLGNASALQASDRSFTVDVYGAPQSYLTRAYPECSRQLINEAIGSLPLAEQGRLEGWLMRQGLAEVFTTPSEVR
jgi:glutathione S-transferase